MLVKDNESLGKAIKNNADTIEIEGDLTKKILRIKATGKVAWAVAIGAIGVAVVAALATPVTGGASAVVGVAAAPAAVSVLGGSAAASAIAIAIAGGGISTLNKLRDYKIADKSTNRVVLKRR